MSPIALHISPPIPIADVRAGSDRIRCKPYSATITADTCVKRQELAVISAQQRAQGTPKVSGWRGALLHADYVCCLDCADGKNVARALGRVQPPQAPKRSPRPRDPDIEARFGPDAEWRPIAGYDEAYDISRSGRVRRRPGSPGAPRGRFIQVIRGHVRLSHEGRQRNALVDALVEDTWGADAP